MVTLTKKHKIYGGLLALGLIALGVDRLIPGPQRTGPAESAAALVVTAAEQGPIPETIAAPAAPPADMVSVADQLQKLQKAQGADASSVDSAFRPAAAWLAEAKPAEPTAPAAVAGPGPAELFLQRHHVSAVMATGKSGYAVIDGRALAVGQTIDGFTLVRLSPRSATLRSSENESVRLDLEDAPGVQPRRR